MTFDQIISDLQKKIYYPVYFLSGEEPYYIDEISSFIENNILPESEKGFNQTVIYGKDSDVESIMSYAKRFPMMSNYQLVIVKEAQDVNNIEELAPYIQNPLKSTILVLCYKYKKFDKRKSLAKNIIKTGVFFESKKLYENQISGWINEYLRKQDYTITTKANLLLSQYLGTDLSKITNEIGKLCINVPKKTQINEDHIEKNIGISKDFNVFELQKALGSRDIYKANQIINYFAANLKENPIVKVVSILYGFFSKIMLYHYLKNKSRNEVASALSINPFFVNDFQIGARNYNIKKLAKVISCLREYDLKSKGVESISTSDGDLYKEMIYKILH